MQEFTSVFDQLAPRCYISVAQYFRTCPDQDTKSIKAHLQHAVQSLMTVQPCLGGVLSEDDDTAFIRFHSRPVPQLGEVEISELDYQHVSFTDLENKQYGPSYCTNPDFAGPSPDGALIPIFRAAVCWYQDGFAVLTFLHHAVADGLSCQYLLEVLAAVTWDGEVKLPRHRQLRLGEPSWKSTTRGSAPADAPLRRGPCEYPGFDQQHCVYTAQGCESGPLAHRGTPIPTPRLAQLLVKVSIPANEDALCSRFCRRATQVWILVTTSRNRSGRFKRRYESSTVTEPGAEEHEAEEEPLAELIFAVGLARADDELGSRALYSKVSYPVSRLVQALDDPAEVRKIEVCVSKAVEAARLPRFHKAHQETFEDYFREGGDPAHINLSADLNDPYVFYFNTWRFMGQAGDRVTPIRWKFPRFSSPRAPDCIRKVAPSCGRGPYGLVQPSSERGSDDLFIILERNDARQFNALVSGRKHAGITSSWEVLDMIEQSA